MGNCYANITTRKVSAEEIVNFLESMNLSAFVIKGPDGYCTICEKRCDEQDTKHISSLLKDISSQFSCPAIGMLNHDDDILAYELWSNGEKVDDYDSCPGYFSGDEERMEPEGGDAKVISNYFCNGTSEETIEKILRSSGDEDEDFVFATDRHQALAKAVGLPSHSVGYGFRYIFEGEIPTGVKPEDILRTSG
ncbi:MAG: hypothetical protein P8010_19995 [Desulfosarcinaceae bacterium]